jgi:hypothetical protein
LAKNNGDVGLSALNFIYDEKTVEISTKRGSNVIETVELEEGEWLIAARVDTAVREAFSIGFLIYII